MASKIQLPVLHINGTDRETLALGYRTAWHAARATLGALEVAGPHARDYYTSPDKDAYAKALRQHLARCEKLAGIIEELAVLMNHCEGE